MARKAKTARAPKRKKKEPEKAVPKIEEPLVSEAQPAVPPETDEIWVSRAVPAASSEVEEPLPSMPVRYLVTEGKAVSFRLGIVDYRGSVARGGLTEDEVGGADVASDLKVRGLVREYVEN